MHYTDKCSQHSSTIWPVLLNGWLLSVWLRTKWLWVCVLLEFLDCNRTQTHNHLVYKLTLNHLAKLAKWLSCVVSTYLYSGFDCMLLSCTVLINIQFLDIQATTESRFALDWHTCYMIKAHSQMHHADKGSQHSSDNWPIWFNGSVFVCELSGCGFESGCCYSVFSWKPAPYNFVPKILWTQPNIQNW